MKAGLLVLCLLPAFAGCGSDKSYALVTVLSSGGQFNDVAGLLVDVKNGTFVDSLAYRPKTATARFDETTALTFSVGFKSSSHMGPLQVAVTSINAAGAKTGYGVGTAPIAADKVTDITVRVVLGAQPPGGADGGVPGDAGADGGLLCDPVNPTTCNGGTCYLSCRENEPPAGMCVMAGTKKPGELCTENFDCVAGSQCFDFNCGTPAVKTCLRFCNDDSVCGAGKCATPIPCGKQATGFKACSQPCDPVGEAQQGCATGLKCFIFEGEIPDCDCAAGTHVKDTGMACTDSNECKPGLLCVSMGGNKTCRPTCRLDSTPATCASGLTCTKLVDPDYKTFGACL
jgi:hypothetical protein